MLGKIAKTMIMISCFLLMEHLFSSEKITKKECGRKVDHGHRIKGTLSQFDDDCWANQSAKLTKDFYCSLLYTKYKDFCDNEEDFSPLNFRRKKFSGRRQGATYIEILRANLDVIKKGVCKTNQVSSKRFNRIPCIFFKTPEQCYLASAKQYFRQRRACSVERLEKEKIGFFGRIFTYKKEFKDTLLQCRKHDNNASEEEFFANLYNLNNPECLQYNLSESLGKEFDITVLGTNPFVDSILDKNKKLKLKYISNKLRGKDGYGAGRSVGISINTKKIIEGGHKQKGLYNLLFSSSGRIDHSVLIYGLQWDKKRDECVFLIKNSWGSNKLIPKKVSADLLLAPGNSSNLQAFGVTKKSKTAKLIAEGARFFKNVLGIEQKEEKNIADASIKGNGILNWNAFDPTLKEEFNQALFKGKKSSVNK